METKMSIPFYGKKSKINKENLLPIYLRVTIEGIRFEVTTNRYVDQNKWSTAAGKVKGNTEEARNINSHLDILKLRVYIYQKEIIGESKTFSVETLREKWFGVTEKPKMMMEIFKHHNEQMAALVGSEYSKVCIHL
jgi:hypothetical protein